MRNCCRKLSWVLVLGVLAAPGAGKSPAQAMASNSAVIQTTGVEGGTGGLSFLDIIGQENMFSSAGPSFSVVEFSSGDLGLGQVSQVSSVTVSLTQSLFGAASRGPMAFLVTDDTTTSIEPDGTSPLIFDTTDPRGLNGQLSNLYSLGDAKFRLVRNGHVDTFTFAITDPNLEAYLVSQISSGGTLRFIIAPDAAANGSQKVGGAYGGFGNANPSYVPLLSVVAQ